MDEDTERPHLRVERYPVRPADLGPRTDGADAAAGRRRSLGRTIRALRGDLTQAELGALIGRSLGDEVGQPTISRWEKGLVDLGYEQVYAVEIALGLVPGTLGIASGYVERGANVPRDDEIKAIYLSLSDEVLDAFAAAAALNLGVHLYNQRREAEEEWVLELFPHALAARGDV